MPRLYKAKASIVTADPMEMVFQAAVASLSAQFAPIDLRPNDPVGWILEHFRIPQEEQADGRLKLAPYQIAALTEALLRDENGLFKYSLVLWGDIKKSIKCLHPLTDVLMGDGSTKHAECVQIGDTVLSWRSGSYFFNTVYAKGFQPASPMYRIETNRGRVLTVTGEHPLLIEGMRGRYPSYKALNKLAKEQKWVKASRLEVGDRVVVGLDWMKAKKCDNADELYTLGVWIGDGGDLVITNMDEEVIERVRKFMPLNKRKSSKYGYGMKGGVALLRKHGLYGLKSRTKRVPPAVFTAGREGAMEFLSGYFDTDGHIASLNRKQPMAQIGSVNEELLRDCQHLLAGIGINAILRKAYTTYKGMRIDVWYLVVQGKEMVLRLSYCLTLSCKHKRERLKAWAERIRDGERHKADSFATDRIVSIDILPAEQSIALSVSDDENHITNGLVTHNSTIAAAVALWSAWHTPYSQNYIVANTREQADSRVSFYLRRCIELNPNFAKECDVNRSNYTITLPNRAFIKAIAVNAAGEAGSNARFVEFTELWGATTAEAERLWNETTTPPNLFGKAQRWCDTYAGFEGESTVLENIYTTGKLEGTRISAEYPFYENKLARQFTLWNEMPRLPWQIGAQGEAYYASERRTLTSVHEYNRIHRNQWSGGSEPFVQPEWIEACRGTVPVYDGEPCIAALDGALTDDSFALVIMDKHGNTTRVRYARVWYPPEGGGQIDFVGDIDYPGPELEIRRIMGIEPFAGQGHVFNVIEWAYDKTHIADMMHRLWRDHGLHVYDFSQGELRLVSDAMFRHAIRDRNFLYDDKPDLVTQIKNANAKITKIQDATEKSGQTRETLRIIKRNQRLKIDACVAASMANYELREAYNIS